MSGGTTSPAPPSTGGQPITTDGVLKWQGVVIGLATGLFVAGASFAAARADIAEAREKSDLAAAKVVAMEARMARFELLEQEQREQAEKIDKILAGVQSMDRKLFALVCSNDPKKCDAYQPSIER